MPSICRFLDLECLEDDEFSLWRSGMIDIMIQCLKGWSVIRCDRPAWAERMSVMFLRLPSGKIAAEPFVWSTVVAA